MDFIDTPYFLLAPLLVLLGLCIKSYGKYFFAVLAAVNCTLIFHSAYIIRQMVGYYQMIMSMLSKEDLANIQNQPVEWTWEQTRAVILLLLPLLFFIKRLSANVLLTMLYWVLLFWNDVMHWYQCLQGKQSFYFSTYLPYDFNTLMLRYGCLVIALYALLWLTKRLPFQRKRKLATNLHS